MKIIKKFNEMFSSESTKLDPESIKKLPLDSEKLKKELDEGLDPSTMEQLLLRVCFRDNLEASFNIILDRIKDHVVYGGSDEKTAKLNLCKRAAEYGRVNFLKRFDELGWFNDFDENDWTDLLEWLDLSRQMKGRPDDKEKTKQFLQGLKSDSKSIQEKPIYYKNPYKR